MAKRVNIICIIDDDWTLDDLNHEANDALCKHDVVMYVEDVEVVDENVTLPTGEDDGEAD